MMGKDSVVNHLKGNTGETVTGIKKEKPEQEFKQSKDKLTEIKRYRKENPEKSTDRDTKSLRIASPNLYKHSSSKDRNLYHKNTASRSTSIDDRDRSRRVSHSTENKSDRGNHSRDYDRNRREESRRKDEKDRGYRNREIDYRQRDHRASNERDRERHRDRSRDHQDHRNRDEPRSDRNVQTFTSNKSRQLTTQKDNHGPRVSAQTTTNRKDFTGDTRFRRENESPLPKTTQKSNHRVKQTDIDSFKRMDSAWCKKRSMESDIGCSSYNRKRPHDDSYSNRTSMHKRQKKDPINEVSSKADLMNASVNSESSNDEEDESVEKWVRSAPEELYYTRNDTGDILATEMTKKLCAKFEKKLLFRAQTARVEAERLGALKNEELTQKEIFDYEHRKELKKQNREHPCCHSNTETFKTVTEEVHHSEVINIKSEITECDKHEEGEICDCENSISEIVQLTETKTCGNEISTTQQNGASKDVCTSKTKLKHSESSNCKQTKCSHTGKSSNASCKEGSVSNSSDDNSDSDSSDEECGISRNDAANRELEKKKMHPKRLHAELWHNDPGLMNDGPLCRCSAKARRFGIRHGFYPGEETIPMCDPFSTNKSKLVHYRITISPPKNFLVKTPTVINHDGHEYLFEGFSLFSHHKVDLKLPPCKVIRFNIRYDIFVVEEKFPESFCVQELQLFETYLFREMLELLDLRYDWNDEGSCAPFHLMPRFVRQLPDNGKEILSMNRVLLHLLKSDREIIREDELFGFLNLKQPEWQNFADKHKGMIVTKFGQKPCSIRVDQIDRDIGGQEVEPEEGIPYPLLVHFGIRPPQLSYAGNASYQRAWRRYVKYRHLLSNMAKPSAEEKRKLANQEVKLQEMRTASTMKRDVTVAVSSRGFRTTGIFCDLVQHAMLIPVLVTHLRFHKSLSTLETRMNYQFTNRYLLQLAMTHPSYRENFGTNPDHARNALTNCGIRQPEYGDRRIHYASTRKRGINTLINIMAKFGSDREIESEITHNERLEFLGDAVVEFVTSIHLFHMFPNLEEGGLATYRAAIVQNQHLAVLAQTLGLDQYMLYAHGSDLCHDSELRHAMANCFEALMGALFLDAGIEVSDSVFGATLFSNEPNLHEQWVHYPRHPLQIEEPNRDRHWIETHTVLQKLTEFENSIGVEFTHIRLLARAFTDRSLGYNNLSKGSNQRLEFLGDTVLQLISSEYLYRHFPDHHEGHLSLLRSSLVNNRTQALVCDDLGMTQYAMRGDPKSEMKTKDRADLLEAVLGALYIDKGLLHCTTFCSVCFFPRLNKSIIKQEWNDPKSKLQQCCLTLRAMDGKEPDIPVYKVTQSLGPTNTRIYIVAVYFRGERLATAQGHSIQEAEMNAAALALEQSGHLFPQLHHQRSVLDKTTKRQKRYR